MDACRPAPKKKKVRMMMLQYMMYKAMCPDKWVFAVLGDEQRFNSYREALTVVLARLVDGDKDGCCEGPQDLTVLDVGFGCGAVAVMAARAGAGKVIHFERSAPLCKVSAGVLAKSDLLDQQLGQPTEDEEGSDGCCGGDSIRERCSVMQWDTGEGDEEGIETLQENLEDTLALLAAKAKSRKKQRQMAAAAAAAAAGAGVSPAESDVKPSAGTASSTPAAPRPLIDVICLDTTAPSLIGSTNDSTGIISKGDGGGLLAAIRAVKSLPGVVVPHKTVIVPAAATIFAQGVFIPPQTRPVSDQLGAISGFDLSGFNRFRARHCDTHYVDQLEHTPLFEAGPLCTLDLQGILWGDVPEPGADGVSDDEQPGDGGLIGSAEWTCTRAGKLNAIVAWHSLHLDGPGPGSSSGSGGGGSSSGGISLSTAADPASPSSGVRQCVYMLQQGIQVDAGQKVGVRARYTKGDTRLAFTVSQTITVEAKEVTLFSTSTATGSTEAGARAGAGAGGVTESSTAPTPTTAALSTTTTTTTAAATTTSTTSTTSTTAVAQQVVTDPSLEILIEARSGIPISHSGAFSVSRWHFAMVNDAGRNDAFQGALERAVGPDDIVLDIGAGSGLLGMMAARAGAGHVYSCELDKHVARAAVDVVRANRLDSRVRIIAKKSNDLVVGGEGEEGLAGLIEGGEGTTAGGGFKQTRMIGEEDTAVLDGAGAGGTGGAGGAGGAGGEDSGEDSGAGEDSGEGDPSQASQANQKKPDMHGKATILVSEILDVGLLGEAVLPTLRHAQQHLLAPGAQIIPAAATVYAVLIELKPQPRPVSSALGVCCGGQLDLSACNSWRVPGAIEQVAIEDLDCRRLSAVFPVFDFDFTKPVGDEEAGGIPDKRAKLLSIPVVEGGAVHAVALWFTIQMDSSGAEFTTGPDNPTNCWKQGVQFIKPDGGLQVAPGQEVELRVSHDDMTIDFKNARVIGAD